MDDTPIAEFAFDYAGRKTVVAGETLEYMQDEALRLGITLDDLWSKMVGEEKQVIHPQLQRD